MFSPKNKPRKSKSKFYNFWELFYPSLVIFISFLLGWKRQTGEKNENGKIFSEASYPLQKFYPKLQTFKTSKDLRMDQLRIKILLPLFSSFLPNSSSFFQKKFSFASKWSKLANKPKTNLPCEWGIKHPFTGRVIQHPFQHSKRN